MPNYIPKSEINQTKKQRYQRKKSSIMVFLCLFWTKFALDSESVLWYDASNEKDLM